MNALCGLGDSMKHLGVSHRSCIDLHSGKPMRTRFGTNFKAEGCSWFKVAFRPLNTNGTSSCSIMKFLRDCWIGPTIL